VASQNAALALLPFFQEPSQVLQRQAQATTFSVLSVQGTIDNRNIGHVFDAVAMISHSKAWTPHDNRRMNKWARHYLNFLVSDHTLKERSAPNNHGAFYDVQFVSVLMYLKQCDPPRQCLSAYATRLMSRAYFPDVAPSNACHGSGCRRNSVSLLAARLIRRHVQFSCSVAARYNPKWNGCHQSPVTVTVTYHCMHVVLSCVCRSSACTVLQPVRSPYCIPES
jgi:hypothetical protein